jgi:dihydropteroate synthase
MTVTMLHVEDAVKTLAFSKLFSLPQAVMQNAGSSLIVQFDGMNSGSHRPIVDWLLARGGFLLENKSDLSDSGAIPLAVMGKKTLFFNLISEYHPESVHISEILEQIASGLGSAYHNPPYQIQCKSATLRLHERTHIMGILNVTPDSFYDGGHFAIKERAVTRAIEMAENGADIIDIGGESSRPGANPVSGAEEIERTIPVVEAVRKAVSVPISIDTSKAIVAEAALKAGADMINDISGLTQDVKMARVVAEYDVPVILMHMQGTPATMQQKPHYDDIIHEIRQVLSDHIEHALKAGISRSSIIVDPGIGFGKEWFDNFTILNRLEMFSALGYPLLVGISRKSCIGRALGNKHEDRLIGTVSAVSASILRGAHIVRVHDVKEMVQAARIADCIRGLHCPA